MKLLTLLAVFLLIEESTLSEPLSSGDGIFCPDSKGKTYASSFISRKDYYVCENGKFIEYRKCPDLEYFNPDTSKCEVQNFHEIHNVKSEGLEATQDLENNLSSNDILNDIETLKKTGTKSEEMQMLNEQKAGTFKKEFTAADESIEFCSSDLDSENACSTTEHYLNLEGSRRGNLYTAPPTDDELHYREKPTSKSGSRKKLKRFTREVIIPFLEDIFNDPSKMSKATSLFKRYVQAIVPLVKEEIKLPEEQTESGSKISNKALIDALTNTNETSSVSKDAIMEFLPLFLRRLSGKSRLFLDTLKEVSVRFQLDYFGSLFRSFVLLLDSYTEGDSARSESGSLSTMFGIKDAIEADIKILCKIVKEVTRDEVFSRKFSFISEMFQLADL